MSDSITVISGKNHIERSPEELASSLNTKRICAYGIVQGVGFRPFVSRIAEQDRITGSVCNKGSYVEILAQGTKKELERFLDDLTNHAPERSAILKVDTRELQEERCFDSFDIIESTHEKGEIFVSPDIAVCPKCKEELFDKKNRRYLHPFINCTACGPRLTILDSMPYDRERTSMGEFPMCDTCFYEYTHPETRRYDAQPVCCNDCGPEVYLIGRSEHGRDAITETRRIIRDGGIVAIKGIGGFHLSCDATNEDAVSRLRRLKTRPAKPFAVMARDLGTAKRECEVSPEEEAILDGHQKPIILLKRKKGGLLCPAIAPGNPNVGLMLPYAPLQLLIFTYDDSIEVPDCLVMTSGNISGAPICRSDEDAVTELSSMCDAILSHDRKIRLRADDSVMDFYKEKPYMIRRSRGYAPLPFMMSGNMRGQVLGVGGELKNTFCLGTGSLFYPSPYIGDMADVRTVNALRESIVRMETLLEIKPEIIACDMHPKYNTTYAAQELARERGIPVFPVQHHYAHIVSCMAENDHPDPVIGVSFDGTGYGTDGTIWGGELMSASYSGFKRIASICPFTQAGGDVSSREGWRIAVSMMYGLSHDYDEMRILAENLGLCSEEELKIQLTMIDHSLNCVTSTSAGRLFDAVSAILGIRRISTFEGEASMALEFAAEEFAKQNGGKETTTGYGLIPGGHGFILLDTERLASDIAARRLAGEDPGELAFFFHQALSDMITRGCRELSRITKLHTVALSGGVFQNHLLLSLCDRKLTAAGFTVLLHSLVPPNDGGIALGQSVAAMTYLMNGKES